MNYLLLVVTNILSLCMLMWLCVFSYMAWKNGKDSK